MNEGRSEERLSLSQGRITTRNYSNMELVVLCGLRQSENRPQPSRNTEITTEVMYLALTRRARRRWACCSLP